MNDEEETEEDEDEDMDIGDNEDGDEGEEDEEEYEDEEEEEEDEDEDQDDAEEANGVKTALNGFARGLCSLIVTRKIGGRLICPWTQAIRRRAPPSFSRLQARSRHCTPSVVLPIE